MACNPATHAAKRNYVSYVMGLYAQGEDNAYEAFLAAYKDSHSRMEGETDLSYVQRCAEQDYHDGEQGAAVFQEVYDQLHRMAKVEQVIQRADGSEVKIVAETCTGSGLAYSIWVYVHRREDPSQAWKLMGGRPHPDWRKMSVDDYIKHGRPEMLQVVTIGEILKVTNALRTNLGMRDSRFGVIAQ